jgi:two-component system chemotaxis response regulator CheB
MSRRPRVLVVDDSAFARMVITRLLSASGKIEVVGSARDGDQALELIRTLDPDVITLDLTMPKLDGLGVLKALGGRPRPRALVVSISNIDTERGAEALALGAIDLVTKPTALATDRLNEIGEELVAKVCAAAAGYEDVDQPIVESTVPIGERATIVLVGTSTGGPQALTRLLEGLPANLAAPLVMVLHIPIGYTEALAARLDRVSAIRVVEASDGLELVPGLAVLARAGTHMRLDASARNGVLKARLSPLPMRAFTPSVDELFLSGAQTAGKTALGVVLTGMGDDGLSGARAISAAGGSLLTEAASSCVVYGMPRCVYEAGLGAVAVPLDRMAEEIVKRV